MIPRPLPSEYLPYYHRYIDLVPDGDLAGMLATQIDATLALVREIGEAAGGHRYAPGKWSIREVVGHITDTERIFAYRALRIARGDTTPLPGYDENAYVERAGFDDRTLADLADELQHVRLGTIDLFRSLGDEALARLGTASDAVVSARALAWIIAGHELHHLALLRERYLPGLSA